MPGAANFDLEDLVPAFWLRGGGEVFAMDLFILPIIVQCGVDYVVDKTSRTAHVQMLVAASLA
ncbi:hypothetical protein D9M69_733330 [compost metagenome]